MMTPLEYQREACEKIGDVSANCIWEIRLPLASSAGTFAISFNNSQTIALPYNASANLIQAALEDLDTVGDGGMIVEGAKKGPYILEANGDLAAMDFEEGILTTDGSNLVPPMNPTVQVLQHGKSPKYLGKAAKLWNELIQTYPEQEAFVALKIRYLLAEDLVAYYVNAVNRRERDFSADERDLFNNAMRLKAETKAAIDQYQLDQASSNLGASLQSRIEKSTPDGQPYGTLLGWRQ